MHTHATSNKSFLYYLQCVFFLLLILYWGKTLFIPLLFGAFIAIVMYPIAKWFEKIGCSKSVAIVLCLAIVGVLLFTLIALLIWQVELFSKDASALFNSIELAIQTLQHWLSQTFGVTNTIQDNWHEKLINSLAIMFSSTLQTTANTLVVLFLTPVYTALIMYHRKLFIQFLQLITPSKYQNKLIKMVQEIIHTYFNYIKGMIFVYIIVGTLNSIGLLILGVKHAILFGMLCAIMTIIPYVGIFISALLPISVSWLQTRNIWYPLAVIGVFVFVQYLEANVIFPKVVGAQLNVSTLAMLIAIIFGGMMWGVAGMVLFIPMVAIVKIISSYIDEWKPLHLLLSR